MSAQTRSVLQSPALQLFLLTAVSAAALYARFAVNPFQEILRVASGLSDNQIALLQGPALALPGLIAAIPLGVMIDRWSRVRLLVALSGFQVVGTLCTALAPNFGSLLLARCLVGFTSSAVVTTSFSLLADIYAEARRGRASTVLVIGQYGGIAAAFGVGGLLMAVSGSDEWRTAMIGCALLLLLPVLAALSLSEPPRKDVLTPNASARDILAELWHYREVIGSLVCGLLMIEVAYGGVIVWATPALARRFSLPPGTVATIMALGIAMSGTVGSIVGGVLVDRCQSKDGGSPRHAWSALAVLTSMAAPAGLFSVATGFVAASMLLVALLTIMGAIFVMATALFIIILPNELRGLCLAVSAAANALFALGLSPVVVSCLSNAIGGRTSIGSALALNTIVACSLGAAAFYVGKRRLSGGAIESRAPNGASGVKA